MPKYSVAARGMPREEIWGSDPRHAAKTYAQVEGCQPAALVTVDGRYVTARYRVTASRRLREVMCYSTR